MTNLAFCLLNSLLNIIWIDQCQKNNLTGKFEFPFKVRTNAFEHTPSVSEICKKHEAADER